jgi:small subunit ribosomal protein S4
VARYTGPVCRLCRREGDKLFLKGERCYTNKCAIDRRAYAPGQHGQGRKKPTQYGIQLRQKQKLRRIYGVSERQFRNYFSRAEKQKGVVGENFLKILERRLDNIVFRLGFSSSRAASRQIVAHGHVRVNGRKVDIPSYLVRPGDQVELVIKTRQEDKNAEKYKVFLAGVQASLEGSRSRSLPQWLEVEPENYRGKLLALPSREEIPTQVNEQLVVEFYSR